MAVLLSMYLGYVRRSVLFSQRTSCLFHGQLYEASQGVSASSLRILIQPWKLLIVFWKILSYLYFSMGTKLSFPPLKIMVAHRNTFDTKGNLTLNKQVILGAIHPIHCWNLY